MLKHNKTAFYLFDKLPKIILYFMYKVGSESIYWQTAHTFKEEQKWQKKSQQS